MEVTWRLLDGVIAHDTGLSQVRVFVRHLVFRNLLEVRRDVGALAQWDETGQNMNRCVRRGASKGIEGRPPAGRRRVGHGGP
jgi:hypothetical protein